MDVPKLLCRVAAGFPSPADDFTERGLDLNDLVVASLRVKGLHKQKTRLPCFLLLPPFQKGQT